MKFRKTHHLFILFLLPLLTSSTSISPNSTLFASNPNLSWSSPNALFSLRFIPLNSSSFSLSVAYDSIPIWTAGVAGPDASFRLLPDGNLRLLSGADEVLWQSNTSGVGVTHADVDDSGNFILKNGVSTVWSSFDFPTDTIVTSQNFTAGQKLTSGSYSFNLNRTGNLTLGWGEDIVFWTSGSAASASNASLSKPWLGLSIGILSLYDINLGHSGSIIAYGSDHGETGNIFWFLRLDSDGNLRMYSYVKGSGGSTVRWTAVSDQCLVFGYCGNMGICSYNDMSPVCGCPSENFDQVDPNDGRKGCRLKREIKDCKGSATMLQMDHTQFLTYASEGNDVYFVGISACRANCLTGDSCVASTTLADGSGQCYIKSSSFVSGYQSSALPCTSYVKVCDPVVPNPPPADQGARENKKPNPPLLDQGARRNKKLNGWIIVVIVFCTLLGLALLEGSLWWWCCRKSPKFFYCTSIMQ